MRRTVLDLVTGIITLLFLVGCVSFAWQPTLATFADDSVSYLVMAQVFSPYQPATQAVAAAFPREAFYPPLFPLLLALSGAAHDIAWAHALTALVLADAARTQAGFIGATGATPAAAAAMWFRMHALRVLRRITGYAPVTLIQPRPLR